jgi:hypothetical protein
MAPEDLEKDSHGHDEGNFLKVKDLILGVDEVKPADDLADNQDGGYSDKKPLQTEKPVFPDGEFIIEAVFKIHESSLTSSYVEHPQKRIGC